MNWKLIFSLSLFGLFMAIGSVYFISSAIEPFFWGAILLIDAFLIVKFAPGKYFMHGFLTCLANCVWVTGAHVLLFSTYAAGHPEEMAKMASGPMSTHPRVMMLIVGPVIGIGTGLVLGLLSWGLSKMMKKKTI
jgi:hypothetical protein